MAVPMDLAIPVTGGNTGAGLERAAVYGQDRLNAEEDIKLGSSHAHLASGLALRFNGLFQRTVHGLQPRPVLPQSSMVRVFGG